VQTNLLKVLKSKKGISPILATLLLIVIAVAAIIVTYAWVMTFMGTQSGTAGTLFKIQNVYWDEASNETRIDVQNYGTSTANIVSLYVGASAENTLEVTVYTDIASGVTIAPEETKTITLAWPNAFAAMWASGQKYYFKVAAQTGSPVNEGPYTAP
jgi:flagellin-like protein